MLSNSCFTVTTHICNPLLCLAFISTEEKEASCLLPAGLHTPPLLQAEQTFLHLISMQRCQRDFCSEWQTSPQITWESSPLDLFQLCLANKRQEAHIHYYWLVHVSRISSRAHRLTVTLNIDNQTHISQAGESDTCSAQQQRLSTIINHSIIHENISLPQIKVETIAC